MNKYLKIALTVIAVAVLLGVIVFVAWGLTPLGPAPEALAAMESNANVTVQDEGAFIAFAPAARTPVTGFNPVPRRSHVDCTGLRARRADESPAAGYSGRGRQDAALAGGLRGRPGRTA